MRRRTAGSFLILTEHQGFAVQNLYIFNEILSQARQFFICWWTHPSTLEPLSLSLEQRLINYYHITWYRFGIIRRSVG